MKIEVEHNGEKWEAELVKKVGLKIVDMSPLINSGVLCQFSDVSWDKFPSGVGGRYGFLYGINQAHYSRPFWMDGKKAWAHCRPVLDYYHGWLGGECPIPEGVSGKLYLRGWERLYSSHIPTKCDWKHDLDATDIIGFKIMGLADGYEWP